jgi:hypothetical protein
VTWRQSERTIITIREFLYLKAGALATVLLLAPGWIAARAAEPPRLILQITVDALRGDLPGRMPICTATAGFGT